MLVTAYNFTLNHSLPVGLVTVNKFDGVNPALACSTTGGKILIHNPHTKDSADPITSLKGKDIQYLNVNKDVACLTGGRLNSSIERDMLMIGSKTNLLVYDVNENADVFDKEVQDGINCMVFNEEYPMVITGGNLSITGFDITSEEKFWTVTGDVANAMEILDWDMDGENELVIGSDDYSIRVFKSEEMIFDINETAKVTFLSKIQKAIFSYALSNGTIGVYSGTAQKWKDRVDNKITALKGVDFDMDGSYQVMIGYQNGKFEVRKDVDGEVIYKANMGSTVSKIVYEDYRLEGSPQAIVWNTDGDVKGYNLTLNTNAYELEDTSNKKDKEAINKMNLEIHALKAELDTEIEEKKIVESNKLAENVPTNAQATITQDTIPGSACITVKVKSPFVIRSVILFSDKMFEGGTLISHPTKSTNNVSVPINSDKNMEWEIECKVLIGKSLDSEEFLTIHESVTYKKFGFFKNIPFSQDFSVGKPPSSQIIYNLRERPNRILIWAQKVFNLDMEEERWVISKADSLDFMILNVKTEAQLIVQARSQSDGTMLQISYDDLETVGDIVQDLWNFIKVDELSPETIDFPVERTKALELVDNIVEYDKLRGHFSANIAESINNAKVFVVKAEFSLMLGDMPTVKKNYATVQQENGNLIGEYLKRRNNHEELVKSLKELNNFIRKASNLHMGSAKKQVVADSREAIKDKKTPDVVKICLK